MLRTTCAPTVRQQGMGPNFSETFLSYLKVTILAATNVSDFSDFEKIANIYYR